MTAASGFSEAGCYLPKKHQIFLRQMPSVFQPLEAQTAAYEMLHVAYDNFVANGQGTALNRSIESNYTGNSDANLTSEVSAFAQIEPDQRDEELLHGRKFGGLGEGAHD